MKRPELNRRDFNRLTFAAFGGMVAGSMVGCQKAADDKKTAPKAPPADGGAAANGAGDSTTKESKDDDNDTKDVSLLMTEPHVCRGLNTCKGKHAGVENDCAGLGACASVAKHACAGENECKGQGGCGTNPGMNSCKGKGSCSVPLMPEAWKLARAEFEKAMKKAGKEVGPAPAAPKE